MIASELVQEAFLQVWLRRHTLPNIENPSAYIYRIISNQALNQFRRRSLEQQILHSIGPHTEPETPTAEQSFDAKELNHLISEAIDRLPPQRHKIFTLSRQEGYSRREIAQQLGISENTVRNQLSIALQSIQEYIQKSTGSYLPLILIASGCTPLGNLFLS